MAWRYGVRHWTRGERADQAADPWSIERNGGPKTATSVSAAEDRIVRRNFTQCSRDWLRVHGCSFSNVIYVKHSICEVHLCIFCDHRIQERSVGLCFYYGQRLNGFAYIAPNTEIQLLASPAQMVDPYHFIRMSIPDYLGLCWQEFVIRKISAQEQQQIAFVHCLVGRAEAEQSAHSHVEWIVVLDERLSAVGMPDGDFSLSARAITSSWSRRSQSRKIRRFSRS